MAWIRDPGTGQNPILDSGSGSRGQQHWIPDPDPQWYCCSHCLLTGGRCVDHVIFFLTAVIILTGWRNGCWRSSSWPTAQTFWRMLSGRSATTTTTSPWSESGQCLTSVADPDPGSGAFLTPGPGSGIRKSFFPRFRIPTPYFLELSDKFLGKKFYNSLKTGPFFFFFNI